jgi:hypothetical protein
MPKTIETDADGHEKLGICLWERDLPFGVATPVTQERDLTIWNITRKDHFQNVEALYEPWYG